MGDKFLLKGKTAIVTGGASGLGLAMVEDMVEAGAEVIVIGSRNKEEADRSLSKFGNQVSFIQFNIQDTDKTPEIIADILSRHGKIDILVNNAGNHCKKFIEDMSIEDYEDVLKTHLVASFALSKAVVPHMKERRYGKIIFTASMTSYFGQPMVSGYATAKSGILGLVHVLTNELGSYGINVNAIAPGWIDTPMFQKVTKQDPPRYNKIIGRIPMGRVGEPDDVGAAAVFLASDAANYINGVCIPVDGGALIGF